jgi:hypothetical protein
LDGHLSLVLNSLGQLTHQRPERGVFSAPERRFREIDCRRHAALARDTLRFPLKLGHKNIIVLVEHLKSGLGFPHPTD